MLMKSVPLQESEKRLYAWAATQDIKCYDKRFNHIVYIETDEGSTFRLVGAFIVKDIGSPEYVWVITEHLGYFVFSKEELIYCEETTYYEADSQ